MSKHFVFLRNFSPSWDWGGTETLLMDWFSRINYKDCRVSVIVPSGSKSIFEKYLIAKQINVAIEEMPFSLRTNAFNRFWFMLFYLFRLKPYQVIFVHGWYADFRCAEFMAAWLTTKGNVYAHENSCPPAPPEKTSRQYLGGMKGFGLWWRLQKFYVGSKTMFCRRILTVSRDVRDQLVKLWGYPNKKITVVHHGIDPNKFSPALDIRNSMRQQWNIEQTSTIIIATARLSQEKRIDRLIDAFDIVAQNRKDLLLLIVGQGPLESELQNQIQKKVSSAHIRLLGHSDNVADILRMSDVYVCSSDVEGFGIALLEAMATGLLSIATRCSGPLDIIEHGKNGFLVERTTDAVASAITMVLKLSDQEKQVIVSSARSTIMERFNLHNNTKQLLKLLSIPSN